MQCLKTWLRDWLTSDEDGDQVEDPFTEEELKKIRRTQIDIDRGYLYTALDSPNENEWLFRCDQCLQVADIMTTPFPHLSDCPMKKK